MVRPHSFTFHGTVALRRLRSFPALAACVSGRTPLLGDSDEEPDWEERIMNKRVLVLLTAWLLAGVVWGQVVGEDEAAISVTLNFPGVASMVIEVEDVVLDFTTYTGVQWDEVVSDASDLLITHSHEDALGALTVTIDWADEEALPQVIYLTLESTGVGACEGSIALITGGTLGGGLFLDELAAGSHDCELIWIANSLLVGTPPDSYEFDVTFTLVVDEED